MAKKMYVGVSDVARKVSKMYVGVNGVARKVTKAYVGVNGVAQQFYTALPKIVTWAGGTDAEIVAMVQAADDGIINLADYWRVGDMRRVYLNSMAASSMGDSHAAQWVYLVLSNVGGKTLTTPTPSGRNTCSFVFTFEDPLAEPGHMNITNINTGGWSASDRRSWCNTTLKNAFPQTLLPIVKQIINPTSSGAKNSDIINSYDYFAYTSEVEVFGSVTRAATGEGSQLSYFTTAANRIKTYSGAANPWNNRSPVLASDAQFCRLNASGRPSYHGAIYDSGIVIMGAI